MLNESQELLPASVMEADQANKIDRLPDDIMIQCLNDLEIFAKVFFPDRFYRPFSPLHRQIFQALNDESQQKTLVLAPRGTGKTSLDSILFPAHRILFQLSKFIVMVSASSTSAVLQAENLKNELMTNEHIIRNFPSFKSGSFSRDQWTTSNGVMVLPRGSRQQIRGLLYNRHRPDLIIVDDLEDPENVRSEDQRKYLKEWFFADLANSIDRGSKSWRIVVVGTLLHEASLLAELQEQSDWKVINLALCDDSFKSNWPEFMSDEEVSNLVQSYREANELDVFYREYMNVPISSEDAVFRKDYFKYYENRDLYDKLLTHFIIIDPAKTVKSHADFSAILCVGVCRDGIYFRDLMCGHFYPDDLYEHAFQMAEAYQAISIGIEVTSLNEFVLFPFKNFLRQKNWSGTLVELKPRGNQKKELRIEALSPLYRRGLIYHNPEACGPLEAQLLSHPRPRRDDASDCAAYTIEMLEQVGFYITQQGIVPAHDDGAIQQLYEQADRMYARYALEYDESDPFEELRLV